MDNWAEHTRFAISLFALINPLAVVPIFVGLTSHLAPREQTKAAAVAVASMAVVLIGAYYGGEGLIRAHGASLPSFQIAGGIIIALSGYGMLSQQTIASSEAPDAGTRPSAASIGVMPVGIPLLAGPGSITAVMLEGHAGFSPTHTAIVLSIFVNCAIATFLVLYFSKHIARLLGPTGLLIFQRGFGLIVIAVGVEVVVRGLRAHVLDFVHSM